MNPPRIWAAFIVLLALSSVPVFSTVLPPLFDYPNHLARMHLLAEGGNAYYTVKWSALPNLAEDVVIPVLSRFVPLMLAGKLFLVLIFLLTAGGTLWLGRAVTGAWRAWPLTGFLFLYTRSFLWGFLNYLAGIGLALCGLALWLRLETSPWPLRVAASMSVALVCYIAHIEAFAVYALAILGVEALPALKEVRSRAIRALARRAALVLPQFLLPLLLFLTLWTPVAGGGWSYARFWRKADLLFSVFDDYNRPFDVTCFVLVILLLGGLSVRRRLGLQPRIAAAAGLLFLAYLALPSQLFSGSGADHRLPAVIFLLLIAGSAPRFHSRTSAAWTAIGVTSLLLVRLGVIERVWLQSDPVYAGDLAALDALPVGAKLAVAFPPAAVDVTAIPETHLPTLAVARREAFVPTLFAYPAQQPIGIKPPFDALAAGLQPDDVWAVFVDLDATQRTRLMPLLAQIDFVVFTARDFVRVPTNPCLTPVNASGHFQIYRFTYAACSTE